PRPRPTAYMTTCSRPRSRPTGAPKRWAADKRYLVESAYGVALDQARAEHVVLAGCAQVLGRGGQRVPDLLRRVGGVGGLDQRRQTRHVGRAHAGAAEANVAVVVGLGARGDAFGVRGK